MSTIYVIGRDEKISYYYSFLLEGNYECSVISKDSVDKSLFNDISKDENVASVIISTELEGADAVIQNLLTSTLKIPLILTHTREHRRAAKIKYKYHAMYNLLEEKDDPKVFLETVNKAFSRKRKMSKDKSSYCRIKAGYFSQSKKTICDVFIKLSNEKFVKIFNRFHKFDNGEVQKYIQKNNSYFYIQEKDYKVFISKMSKALESKVLDDSNSNENKVMTSLNCQEMVQEMIEKLGLNENAVSMTNIAISSTLKIIESGNIKSLFNDVFNSGEFIAERSLIVTYLSCAICKETQWNSKINILRLCLAGFFHDITLKDEKIARVTNLDSFLYEDLYPEEKSEVLKHAQSAVGIISKIEGIPVGVDNIIESHHEKYDGSGFPKKIDYKRFSPLSAIFIVAHEIADYLFDSGFVQDNINDIILEMEENYTKGCFKKITPVLRSVLGDKNLEIDMAG